MSRMTSRVLSHAVLAAVLSLAVAPTFAQAPTVAPRAAAKPRTPPRAKIDAARLYADTCAVCHGQKGEGTPMGRPLAAPLMNGETVEAIAEIMKTGIEGSPMMSFSKRLTPAQIDALAAYVAAMKR
jgi:mono/diheme cytochrome c family protein